MATLEEYQKDFIQELDSDFEEYLSNGHSFQGSPAILPMYRYRDDTLFGSNLMLPQVDPTYPPFNTVNPTRKTALKSTFLGLVASFMRKMITFKKSEHCILLNGHSIDVFGSLEPLVTTRFFDGSIQIKGAFITASSVNTTDSAFRIPDGFPRPPNAIWFNNVSNNVTTRMVLSTNGEAYWVGTLPATSSWSYVNITYRP